MICSNGNSLKGKASLVWSGGYGKHFDLILLLLHQLESHCKIETSIQWSFWVSIEEVTRLLAITTGSDYVVDKVYIYNYVIM